jgi:hypothetical protein
MGDAALPQRRLELPQSGKNLVAAHAR